MLDDGSTEPHTTIEYVGYGMHRGRDVLVVEYTPSPYAFACPTAYWDLETGNVMSCLDDGGEISTEWIPYTGVFAFPMMAGMREPWVYGWQSDGHESCDEICEDLIETWTVEECGIELALPAGTFTVCRQSATANWDADLEWIEWYDPVNHLSVKTTIHESASADRVVTELANFELVE